MLRDVDVVTVVAGFIDIIFATITVTITIALNIITPLLLMHNTHHPPLPFYPLPSTLPPCTLLLPNLANRHTLVPVVLVSDMVGELRSLLL